jgi:hypothetical protein
MSRARSILLLIAILTACGTLAQASEFQYDLNAIYCNCLPAGGSAGTVTLTDFSPGVVQISVQLAGGLTFHQSNGLDAFVFNTPVSIAGATVTNGGGASWTFGTSGREDGAGTFMYQLTCVAAPNGCVGDPSTLVFTITQAGLTAATFGTTNDGASNTYFAVNVANPENSGCTGMVGGGGVENGSGGFTGGSNCVPNVPEPTSIAFFGTGLLVLGIFVRRRLATQN